MDIKAVFLDIDGTFFDHVTNQVLPETLIACEELKKKGYKVALCSGRPKEMADDLHVFELFDWDGYIGCAGGVAMNDKFEIIFEDGYTNEQMQQIFEIGEKHNLCLYSFGRYEFMTQPLNSFSKQLIEEFHLRMPEIRKWNKEALNALSVVSEHKEDFRLFDHIEGISQTSSTHYCMDFLKDGVHKANGICQLMKYWGFDEHAYVAFGDSLNDYEMLAHAQVGVAMGNGHEKLHEVANIICGPSFAPSIYETLKKLQLI